MTIKLKITIKFNLNYILQTFQQLSKIVFKKCLFLMIIDWN
jgi:hypothetical protein